MSMTFLARRFLQMGLVVTAMSVAVSTANAGMRIVSGVVAQDGSQVYPSTAYRVQRKGKGNYRLIFKHDDEQSGVNCVVTPIGGFNLSVDIQDGSDECTIRFYIPEDTPADQGFSFIAAPLRQDATSPDD